MPVHISVTDPIFSHASSFFTSNYSFLSVSTEKAIAIEIERGSPSGTATMITATAIVKLLSTLMRVSVSINSVLVNMILNE